MKRSEKFNAVVREFEKDALQLDVRQETNGNWTYVITGDEGRRHVATDTGFGSEQEALAAADTNLRENIRAHAARAGGAESGHQPIDDEALSGGSRPDKPE